MTNPKGLLELLSEKHTEWIRMTRSLTGRGNLPLDLQTAESIVSDMYIRLYKYVDDPEKIMFEENEVNTMYVYMTLRNLYITMLSNNKKSSEAYVPIESVETDVFHEDYDERSDRDLKRFENRVMKDVNSFDWFEKKVFKLILVDGFSYRKLADETGISVSTLFHTVKVCKMKLNDKFGDKYKQLRND